MIQFFANSKNRYSKRFFSKFMKFRYRKINARRFGIFINKFDFINKVDGIDRINPKILYYPINKPENNFTNKHIIKSSPQINHLKTKRSRAP